MSRIEAELAKGKLENYGIESYLINADMNGHVYAITRGDIKVKLMVNEKQATKAKTILCL